MIIGQPFIFEFNMAENYNIPNREELEQLYQSYTPVFGEILSNIKEKLKNTIKLDSPPTYKSRIKSFKSYYKKVLKKRQDKIGTTHGLISLTDMIGIRVVCPFLEDVNDVEEQVKKIFNVTEIEIKGADQNFKEFGYESIHILVEIPDDCLPVYNTALDIPKDMVCEIQVRTILQDAWAEVEHELIYKSEFNPFDKPLRRKLASINASLTLADMIFQEIRDYQNKLQVELGVRRNTFYNKADEYADSELGIPYVKDGNNNKDAPQNTGENKENKSLGEDNPFESGSIDDLVLKALHEHNIGNYPKAIKIYSQIIDQNPYLNNIMLSVIYKHRGMAHFAQSDYDKALRDFKMSAANDASAFRTLYYEGIVYSVKDMHKEAIECFNQSLDIDGYQSHVYARRALAYYNLGQYKEALKDLDNANDLGLNDDDCKALREKLIKKFDMNM